jgi:serine/threonine protein kinase
MNIGGFTDSLANLVEEPIACPECGGVPRLANGLCLGCLLQAGLEPDGERGESFVSLLSRIDISDSHWRVGHYEILEEIARGGMGVVYRARQQFSRRIVALKSVLSHYADSPQTLARFRRESEAASLLDHPNILPIYEVGETDDGLPFFAMKFAPGGSLREARVALGRAPGQVVPILLSVSRAVHAAHEAGLLHRDLKPGNILLDARGEPLVSPRASPQSGDDGTGGRPLQSWRNSFRLAQWPAAFPGRKRVRSDLTSGREKRAHLALAHSLDRSRLGNHLHPLLGTRSIGSLRFRSRIGR